MFNIRRIPAWLTATVSFPLMIMSGAAQSQNFPAKAIRIVAPEAGGGADFVVRLVAQGMTGGLGQQVIVDNRGGSAAIPADLVAKASATGYTLLFHGGTVWMLPLLQSSVPYDMARDFAPLTLVANSPSFIAVHPSLAATSVKELIVVAKARPGQLNYGSAISGSTPHLAVELFKAMAGVDIVRVSYKGAAPALNAVIAGEAQVIITVAASVAPHVKSGRLRGLAITSAEPSPMFPGVPTVAATLPGYEAGTMHVMFAPAGTPAPIVNRLQREVARVVNGAELKEKLYTAGIEGVGSTPEQLAATMKADVARMGKVIRDAGIRAD